MDALSQLLSLARARVVLDVRCLFGGKFEIRHDSLAAGEAVFHLLLAGHCRIRVDDKLELNLKAGDFVLLSKGDMHTVTNEGAVDTALLPVRTVDGNVLPLKCNDAGHGDGGMDLLCGRYHYADGAGSRFTEWLPKILQVNLLDTADRSALSALIGLLRAEATGEPLPAARAVIDALAQALLGFALRVYAQDKNITTGFLSLMADARLGPSVNAVISTPGHPWTIAELGGIAGMSRATYARHFQIKAGIGVGAFLTRVRMMHACALLEQGSRSIADIAEAVGYGSEAAFGVAFRDAVGETPARWRRSRRDRSRDHAR